MIPVVLDFVLDQVDLTALVLRRVDLDAVAARLDLDAAAARHRHRSWTASTSTPSSPNASTSTPSPPGSTSTRSSTASTSTPSSPNASTSTPSPPGLDIDAILDRIDFNAVVAQRVDLIGLAEYVVDGIDLPRIIRESTGSVASESLRGVRTRSMDADQALAGLVDRMLMRRRSGRDRAHENGSAETSGRSRGRQRC